jgi:hypothetical protein
MLKDALVRNLAANGLRLPTRRAGELLALPQPDIMEALALGPAGTGAAAAILREAAVPDRRRRGGNGAGEGSRQRLGRL